MDLTLFATMAVLLAWGGLTVATDAPGWVHLLLTAGVFLLVWRIVVRDTPSGPRAPSRAPSRDTQDPTRRR